MHMEHGMIKQHTFITFVGEKLLGPIFLGSSTLTAVGVGVTVPRFVGRGLQHFSDPKSVGATTNPLKTWLSGKGTGET